MSIFGFGRKKDKEREEEEGTPIDKLLRAEATRALPVNPFDIKQNIIQELFSKPLIEKPREELYIEELDKRLNEAAEKLHTRIVSSISQLSQLTLNVINSKTLRASLLLILNNVYTDLQMNQYAISASIDRLAERILDPSVDPGEKSKDISELMDKILTMLAIPRAIVKILKDLDSIITLNIPFHLKSDVIRNLMGYTAS